jgi:hypothetical protein
MEEYKMPIKSMKCSECGSSECTFDITYNNRNNFSFDKTGEVFSSDVKDIKVGSNIFSKLLTLNRNYSFEDGISASCSDCEEECGINVKFSDGHTTEHDAEDAFEYLLKFLLNKSTSNVKITTDYLKSLIPPYINKHKLIFGSYVSDSSEFTKLLDIKNWSRVSKSKVSGEVLRVFDFKPNTNIKLNIFTNASDNEVLRIDLVGNKKEVEYETFDSFFKDLKSLKNDTNKISVEKYILCL